MNSGKIIVYTTRYCPYSRRVSNLLEAKGVEFQQVSVDKDPGIRKNINNLSNQTTFPQVFVGGYHVGNCEELYRLDRDGELDDILGLKQV